MDPKKKARLEKAGWKIGTVAEFLCLTKEQEERIEKRVQEELEKRKKDK